jgi:hypothetical protein
MKRFWSSNLVTLAYQKSTTSSCIDNFRFCLSINKNGRIIRFQWMNQTTKRKAPSGRVALTRTTRKDKHRKYRSISEMRNALKLNQQFFEGLKYRDRSVMSWTIHITVVKENFTLGSYKACLLIIWQKHTVNNYPTTLRLKVNFYWSDKNGVVGSKLSFK